MCEVCDVGLECFDFNDRSFRSKMAILFYFNRNYELLNVILFITN